MLPAWANEPCEQVAIPEEDQLPPLAEDRETLAVQLRERGFWMGQTREQEAVRVRVCRQRNEATGNIAAQRQMARELNE